MSEIKPNWQYLWKNPVEIVNIMIENQKILSYIKSVRKSIIKDIKERRRIQKGGFIYEGRRKERLMKKVAAVDPVLSEKMANAADRDELLDLVDRRIAELTEAAKKCEEPLNKITAKEKFIDDAANRIVDRYFEILAETKELYKKQLENVKLNIEFETELADASETGKVKDKVDHYIKEGEKTLQRSKENMKIEERLQTLSKEADELRKEAEKIKHLFEKETEEIGTIRKMLSAVFPWFANKREEKREEKEDEKEAKGLRPAWAH